VLLNVGHNSWTIQSHRDHDDVDNDYDHVFESHKISLLVRTFAISTMLIATAMLLAVDISTSWITTQPCCKVPSQHFLKHSSPEEQKSQASQSFQPSQSTKSVNQVSQSTKSVSQVNQTNLTACSNAIKPRSKFKSTRWIYPWSWAQ
jgi:hypothetical protein